MDSRVQKIRKFMLQEEEDDDELFLVLLPAIYSSLYEEKRPVHTSSLRGAQLVKEILEGHESWCKVEFRMEPQIFRAVSNYLKREHLLEGTTRVDVDEQLGMFLYMISHNATNQDLQKKFQHSAETVHRKLNEIINLIPLLVQRFVKVPSSLQPHPKIMSNPRFWPYFQNCIGAIDGTHIPITIAEEIAAPYRNRKGTLSQNVMVAGSIATGDLNFLSIPHVDLTSDVVAPTDSSSNQHGMVNPFSTTHDGGQSSNVHVQEVEPTSASSGQKGDEPVRKRKQSQIAQVLEEYVDFRKQQCQKFVEELKEPKQTEQFTIGNCVAALETMEDLSREEKSKCLRLFKCPDNREIFLNTKDPILRTLWLKDEISAMEKA